MNNNEDKKEDNKEDEKNLNNEELKKKIEDFNKQFPKLTFSYIRSAVSYRNNLDQPLNM